MIIARDEEIGRLTSVTGQAVKSATESERTQFKMNRRKTLNSFNCGRLRLFGRCCQVSKNGEEYNNNK